MRNTHWGRTFARSLNRYCGHGVDFDRMGTLHWPNDVRDWMGHLHWSNDVRIFWDRHSLLALSLALRWGRWLELIAPQLFFQQRDRCSVRLCCRCNICQLHGVFLIHLSQQRRVGLWILHIGPIPLGLRSPGVYLCFFKRSCEVSFKIAPGFVKPRFAGTFPEIILI